MGIVKIYEKCIINNKEKIKEEDELLDSILSRLIKGITNEIIVYGREDFLYVVVKLVNAGATDILFEEKEDNYRLYVKEQSKELRIEGEYIIR